MARRKRLPACEAKKLLQARGVDMNDDFHALHRSDVEIILDVAKAAGYRKSRFSQSSLGRAGTFYYYLQRKRGC